MHFIINQDIYQHVILLSKQSDFLLFILKKNFCHISFQKKLFAYENIKKLTQTPSQFFCNCILWNKKISILIFHQIFSTSVIVSSIFSSAPFNLLQSYIASDSTTRSSLAWRSEKEKEAVYISRVKCMERNQLPIFFFEKKNRSIK